MIDPSQKIFNVVSSLSVKMEKDFGTNEPSFLGLLMGEIMRRMVDCFGIKDTIIIVNRTLDRISAASDQDDGDQA